jgi:hypothetical protein
MSDYPDAIDYYVDRSRVFQGNNSCSAIVVHGTGGSAEQTVEQLGDWFRTNASQVSSHFGIGRDGRVAQYVRLWDGAAANCCPEPGHDPFWDQFGGDNLNVHTISIECINDQANSLPLAEPQKLALFGLVKWLCQRYSLGPEQVKSHSSIAPLSRARCPGVAFPFDELQAFLKGESMQHYGPGVGDFDHWFIDGGSLWQCKQNGHALRGALKDFFAGLSIDGKTLPLVGLPLEPEQLHVDADGYKWWSQRCERGSMVCDPERRHDSQPGFGQCYLNHIVYDQPERIVVRLPDSIHADIKDLEVVANRLVQAIQS